jgi:hypothetical protein
MVWYIVPGKDYWTSVCVKALQYMQVSFKSHRV